MQAILFIGIPATGKSTFYKQDYADTHVRVNGDMLKGNKGCEKDLIDACLRHGQPFVIDKMNFTKKHRASYLEQAKLAGFLRIGYYFQSVKADALRRNRNPDREEKNLPDVAVHNAAAKLEMPNYAEGFDKLYYVKITCDETFLATPWEDR